jgi:UDP-2,4-diacetamido-2,4,6-trideoxy-beta-L-altropyranose hydrolase
MNIFFRTDSSEKIGSGHVSRCLALAALLKYHGNNVSFISRPLPGNITGLITGAGFEMHLLPLIRNRDDYKQDRMPYSMWLATSWEEDAYETINFLIGKDPDWLIVDHYGLEQQWETSVSRYVKTIMVIDDLADRYHNCDLLLDQNLCPDWESRYSNLVPAHCRLLLGPHYALLRKEFMDARRSLSERNGHISRILVFFGGTDPYNLTGKALAAINKLNMPDLIVDVIVGSTNPNREKVRELCNQRPNTNYYCQIRNMASLMAKADLAVGAGGSATWERCSVGLPTVTLNFAENQRPIASAVSEKGASIDLGWASDVSADKLRDIIEMLINSPERVKEMARIAFAMVDSCGAERVLEYLSGRKS